VRTLARYSVPFVAVAIALLLTVWLGDLVAPVRLIFLWVAVMVAALVGGTVAGLLASAFAILGAWYLFFDPGTSVIRDARDVFRLTLFGGFATAISMAVGRTRQLAGRLRLSEQRYRTIVESSLVPQAVWTTRPDGTMNWSAQWGAITGQTPAEVEAHNGIDALHPDDVERTQRRWRESLASGALYEDELRIRMASGEYRWFAAKASPVRDRGRILEWVGIIVDVHDRKRHDERASFINRASEILSSTLASQEAMRNLARLCVPALGDACAIHLGDDRVVVEPEGAELPAGAIAVPLVAHGRPLGKLVVASRDPDRSLIEELARRAAMAIDNAHLYEAAEEANRAKDNFLATLSHELRTPLTAIVGWAHMLHAGIEDDSTRRLAIETILSSSNAQRELIDDLIDVSRVVAGTLRLDLRPVDFAKVVGETVVAARPAAEAKQIALTEEASGPVIVRGDERRLRQVAWNLITNAVKFTDRGGSASVSVVAGDGVARLEVSDTGRGIDPAFLPHVWERFRQADSSTSREHGGLGLGLAVVKHLAEMHGGTVHAQSEGVGRGATFRVEIPLGDFVASGPSHH
jgi:PAS domain S-box-containing protein